MCPVLRAADNWNLAEFVILVVEYTSVGALLLVVAQWFHQSLAVFVKNDFWWHLVVLDDGIWSESGL